MKTVTRLACAVIGLALLLTTVSVADQSVAISTLMSHTSTYDGQHVSVTGTVSDVVAVT